MNSLSTISTPESMTYIGFNQGQYGDLFIGLTACRKLKEMDSECSIVYSVNKKFEDSIPVLKMNKDIDGFIVWDAYDGWPSEKDNEKLINLAEKNPDTPHHVFAPMQSHIIEDWYNYWHQTEEVCVMHRLSRPTEEEMDFQISKPKLEEEETITICAGIRRETGGRKNSKALTQNQIELVKSFAKKNKLKVIQIAGPEEEKIEGAERFQGNYSDSIIKVLRSKLLVSCDTGMIWAASAFSHPTVGLYDLSYYPLAQSCKNWTPKNKKQKTIEADVMENIDLQQVEEALNFLYNKSK